MAEGNSEIFSESTAELCHTPTILSIPEEILDTILTYLSFNEISELRPVCHQINKRCQALLNTGFTRVDRLHSQIQKKVKSQLPRRESERRNHPLARHVDILSAIETRLSLLSMTYMRYIDTGLCCFIPGKVLDELLKILKALQRTTKQPTTDQPPRAHEFLQELRDISSMAMEHFEEKIAPTLKTRLPALPLPYPFNDSCSSPDTSGQSSPVISLTTPSAVRGPPIRHELSRLTGQFRSQSLVLTQYKREITDMKNRWLETRKKTLDQEKKIQNQKKKLNDQTETINEQQKKINELNKKILEYDVKFEDIYSEITKLKEDKDVTRNSRLLMVAETSPTSALKRKPLRQTRTSTKRQKT
ncbi:F-box only protein 28-like [Mytilus galloprovincialis]|uniref:F-box protein 28 n=2 Tax=Mytilus TaxID=6548 RepID=A0A8B6F2B2_MYTGA|nr:FBXO28 [Mytilus edulis]VDI42267.1 F-box protein 28 [Mytilus galloprovincialis]